MQKDIILATINARYIHSAFGLRYLQANLGQLQADCEIKEFTLESRAEDIAEVLLSYQPKIIGLGVYIWNTVQTQQLLALLKTLAPDLKVVLGGPEVSYEQEGQSLVQLADYVITGWGDISFAKLAKNILSGNPPVEKIHAGEQPKLAHIQMPYLLYNEDDVRNRVLYVEASRGCPFKCEFCLSALDKTAWPFDLDLFLGEMELLYKRGARHFKFVDRTFNLKVKNSLRIMQFFLDRMDERLFLHFEVVPDHLPSSLKDMIARFPVGSLQFEIGIQTFNPEVQQAISRRQDNEKAKQNISWILEHSNAYVHTDLIFGLPGESLESFANSFNQLVDLAPHEIQVGILKRLKGSPIVRHTEAFELKFNPNPPFSIVSSNTVTYGQVQELGRFARYWDLIGNSGRFKHTLAMLLAEQPFENFSKLSRELFQQTGQTHKISLLRLYDLVFKIGSQHLALDNDELVANLRSDFEQSGLKSVPKFLRQKNITQEDRVQQNRRHNTRQARH